MAKPKLKSAVHDFTINQGDDFRFQLTLKDDNQEPLDISKYKFQCMVQPDTEDETMIIKAEWKIIDGPGGIVEFHFKDEDTSQIDTSGTSYDQVDQYAYDLLMKTPEGEVTRLLNGAFFVSPGISWRGE